MFQSAAFEDSALAIRIEASASGDVIAVKLGEANIAAKQRPLDEKSLITLWN
jgi:hypothetical protein